MGVDVSWGLVTGKRGRCKGLRSRKWRDRENAIVALPEWKKEMVGRKVKEGLTKTQVESD